MCLSYSALNGRSWHWRQFADPWRPWQIGPNFSSQAFHRTNSIISKAENHANSGNIAYYTFLYYKRQSYCPLLAKLHPGSGYPGHPRLLFQIHLQQPDRFGFGTAVQILCPTCDAQRAGPRHRQHLGPTKGAKVLEVRFRRYWTWAMGWCGRRIFMAYVMPWPRQLSKHPLFAPNASLSSLEGDDKEPSCAGEAILAWKSSQSHPLFMCKHASLASKQWKTMPFLPLGHKMPRSSTKMNSYQYKYHEPSPPRCSFAVDEQRLGSGCREHQVEDPARPGSWMVTWSLFNERSIMFNFRGLSFIHRWFIILIFLPLTLLVLTHPRVTQSFASYAQLLTYLTP